MRAPFNPCDVPVRQIFLTYEKNLMQFTSKIKTEVNTKRYSGRFNASNKILLQSYSGDVDVSLSPFEELKFPVHASGLILLVFRHYPLSSQV